MKKNKEVPSASGGGEGKAAERDASTARLRWKRLWAARRCAQSVRPRTGTGAPSALGEAICAEWGWTTPCLLVCFHPVLLLLWPPLGDPTGCSACRWHM